MHPAPASLTPGLVSAGGLGWLPLGRPPSPISTGNEVAVGDTGWQAWTWGWMTPACACASMGGLRGVSARAHVGLSCACVGVPVGRAYGHRCTLGCRHVNKAFPQVTFPEVRGRQRFRIPFSLKDQSKQTLSRLWCWPRQNGPELWDLISFPAQQSKFPLLRPARALLVS